MLKRAVTLAMFVTAGLIFAIGSSAPTTLIGFAMLGVAISTEVAAWHRVVGARRSGKASARR
jgi:hypothetical protein